MRIWIVKICQADVKKLSERKVRVAISFLLNIVLGDGGDVHLRGAWRWGENSNSGMRDKAGICYENLVRHRVYRQGMSTVVSADLIQGSIIVRSVLLDHRQLSGFPGDVNSMKSSVECDRVRPAADPERRNDPMALQVKNHQFGISATDRKEPSLLGINCHARWSDAWCKRPLPNFRPLADIDCSYLVCVF